jgi:hypothetical protein
VPGRQVFNERLPDAALASEPVQQYQRLAAPSALVVDLPGFGRSAALPADLAPTPVALAQAVAAFLMSRRRSAPT